MNHAVDCDLFLYADNSCLVYQHRDIKKTEKTQIKPFQMFF